MQSTVIGSVAAVLIWVLAGQSAAQHPEDARYPQRELNAEDGYARWERSNSFPRQTYTPVPVEIDPLGADPDTPWIVWVSSLRVRSGPSTSHTQIGSLDYGAQVSGIYHVVVETDEEWIEIEWGEGIAFISRTGVHRIHPQNLELIDAHTNLPYGYEIVNRWWGIPHEYEPDDLVAVPGAYVPNPNNTYLLRQTAAESVVEMIDAARADGIDFLVSSPYRSGERQRQIYSNNVANNLAQRSSAPPGHSEHQLGTTVDFARPGGGFLRNTDPQYHWLAEHGIKFGWRQSYTADNIEETGYIEEPWHWRFFQDTLTVADAWVFF